MQRLAAAGAAEARVRSRLVGAGLRPTRQRLALGALLLEGAPRHVTAEALHAQAQADGAALSLATVYNTLNAFLDAGLVRQVALDGERAYFDTNVEPHHHFFDEATGALIDIPADAVGVSRLPAAPDGYAVERVDVVVRLRKAS